MTAGWAADLVRALAATPTRQAMGAVLARLLPEGTGADAVVVWMPRTEAERPLYSTVFVGGALTCTDALLQALADGTLPQWLSDEGFSSTRVAGHLPQDAGVALAWRGAMPAGDPSGAALELLSAYVSSVLHAAPPPPAPPPAVPAEGHRGVLASGLVHDFNNCLTTILGFTEMAMGHVQPGQPVHDHLVTIRTVALDAAVVIKRLQALNKGVKLAPDRSLVDVAELAVTMREMTRPRWERTADRPGPPITVDVRGQAVPAVLVVPAELRELLMNLLFNAFDAMPVGGTVTITTRTGADGWAEVTVADTGTGIAPEVLGRIFEPFYSTKGPKGSGLGLSVCRTIAQRYGGTLTASSMVGVGTTFTLRLPPASRTTAAPVERDPHTTGAVTAKGPGQGGRRVLLVDDQESVLAVVGRMLQALGHDVVTAMDGPSALSAASSRPVDLVMTDYHMPGMNGAEVASRLQSVAPTVPVVVFSGTNLASMRLPSNVARALCKPLTMAAVGEVVSACANAGAHA